MAKTRQEVFESYQRGSDNWMNENSAIADRKNVIGNVNTLSNFEIGTAGYSNTSRPTSTDNLRWEKNLRYMKDYFRSLDNYYFKYGLEIANDNRENVRNRGDVENLDEDPIIFGFDLVVNRNTSPLYTELPLFFDWADEKGISEISNRRNIYEKFMMQFELIFFSTQAGGFDTFKGHYLIKVDGLGDLMSKATGLGSEKQFTDFGKDKIALTLREDVNLSSGYMSTLYKTLAYSKINGKQIIPDNLLRFDCTIVISEMRNYKRVTKVVNGDVDTLTPQEYLGIVNDNVSRYMYNLYECQFPLFNHSHPNSVSNASNEVQEEWDLDFFYKFSDLQFEKFEFKGYNEPTRNYTNDGKTNPNRRFNGNQGDVYDNLFIKSSYYTSKRNGVEVPFISYDSVKSNNIIENTNVREQTVDDIRAIKNASISAEQQRQRDEIQNRLADPENQTGPQDIIKKVRDAALKNMRRRRDELINDTINSIRNATGLRRINAPHNVYDDNLTAFGVLKTEVSNFTNNAFTGFLSDSNDAINGN